MLTNPSPSKRFTDQFSRRTQNCLWHLNLKTKKKIKAAVRSRVLHPSNVQALNFGTKCYHEVLEKLGLRLPLSGQKVYEIRCRLAVQLAALDISLTDIGRILRLGSKEKVRQHIARSQRTERTKCSPN